MNRRSILGTFGGVLAGALGFGVYTGELSLQDLGRTSLPEDSESGGQMKQTFGMFSKPFKNIQWSEDGTLVVRLSEDAGMDGFGIRHEDVPDEEYDRYTCFRQTVFTSGGIEIDFKNELSTKHPSRTYVLVAMNGTIGQDLDPHVSGITASQEFTVPKKAVADEHFA